MLEHNAISVSRKIMFKSSAMVMFCFLNLIHVILVKKIGAIIRLLFSSNVRLQWMYLLNKSIHLLCFSLIIL
jgi:hypothetical protein